MGIKDASITETIGFDNQRAIESNRKLTRDEIFQVLSNDRRRYALHYLKRHEGETIPLRDVVDAVAAWENDVEIDELDSNTRKCVYTALRQSHLPRLDDVGVIDYDHLRGEATITEAARDVQMYLEYVPDNDLAWHQFYLGLSVIASTIVVLKWLGIPPFSSFTWATVSIVVISIFTFASIYHTYFARKFELGTDELVSRE